MTAELGQPVAQQEQRALAAEIVVTAAPVEKQRAVAAASERDDEPSPEIAVAGRW